MDGREGQREGWSPLLQASFLPVILSTGAVQSLLRLAQPLALERGTHFLSRAHTAERYWLLMRGHVAMGSAERGFIRQHTREVTPGHWIDNASAMLGANARYLEDAIIERDALVWSFARAGVVRCGLRHPELLHGLAAALAARVRDMLDAELRLMQQSIESRFAAWLLHNAAPGGGDACPGTTVVLRQHKRAIASQLGATPETLSRVLRQLSNRGALTVRGYTIELSDMDMLRGLAASRH
jgi:CRP-like cAMP-binding protein